MTPRNGQGDHAKVWAATLVTFGAVVAMWAVMLPDTFKNTGEASKFGPRPFGDFRERMAEQAAEFDKSISKAEQRLTEIENDQINEIQRDAVKTGASELREKIEAAGTVTATEPVSADAQAGTETTAEPKLP